MSSPIENLESKRNAFERSFKARPSDNTLLMMDTARAEAAGLQHNYIGTEHLMLAASLNPDTAEILDKMELTPTILRESIEFIMGRGPTAVKAENIGLTPRAKIGITLGIDEAKKLFDSAVDPSHILLGLARREEQVDGGGGIAMGILEYKGYKPGHLRTRVLSARQNRLPGNFEEAAFQTETALADLKDLNDLLTRPGINIGVKANIAAILQIVNRTYNPKFRS